MRCRDVAMRQGENEVDHGVRAPASRHLRSRGTAFTVAARRRTRVDLLVLLGLAPGGPLPPGGLADRPIPPAPGRWQVGRPPPQTSTRPGTTSCMQREKLWRGVLTPSARRHADPPALSEGLVCCAPQSRRDLSTQRWPRAARRPHLPRRRRSVPTKRPAAATHVDWASPGRLRSRRPCSFGNRSI
jgi:pimeloyl-ACP methyl ester carboxylesterase